MRFHALPLLLITLPCGAYACTIRSPSPDEIAAKAHSIFVARITEIRVVQAMPTERSIAQEMLEAKFDLKEQVKGFPPQSLTVRTHLSQPGECGAFFLLAGMNYVLVLNRADDPAVSVTSFVLTENIPGSAVQLESLRQSVRKRKLHLRGASELNCPLPC